MSNLQDTPQQALAGWLHQRGGERAIKKMADDLRIPVKSVQDLMRPTVEFGFIGAITLCLYTDGEVIFPNCPDWAVEKVKGLPHG